MEVEEVVVVVSGRREGGWVRGEGGGEGEGRVGELRAEICIMRIVVAVEGGGGGVYLGCRHGATIDHGLPVGLGVGESHTSAASTGPQAALRPPN